MEFDEIRKIWDAQNNQPLYVIDEKAMHKYIRSKMKGVLRLANMREWAIILFYLGATGLMLGIFRFNPGVNIFGYVLAAWMFATVVYIVISRTRRIKANRRFDRSIHGDLDHAISLLSYQMRLSLLTNWNLLPMGVIMILFGWEVGQLFKVCVIVLVSDTLAFCINNDGYREYKRRKRALQVLKEKLEIGC